MACRVIKPIINCVFCLCILSLLLLTPPVLSKSRRPISDNEIRQKKSECYADIESGIWGQQCKSSAIAKENCVLRCLSYPCYQLIYESDPLEEGEKDHVRSQEYKYCMYKCAFGMFQLICNVRTEAEAVIGRVRRGYQRIIFLVNHATLSLGEAVKALGL